ncbi:FecR domain-containing protein [Persicitalea sp.]|uniref:FecR domain-containing protein n=1 Tax=Persicitalea sp. TaxID=3100273 RepID=UPI0035947559
MPKDFSHFEIEDFAFHESFQDWVLRPQSAHRSFWEKYLAAYPGQTNKMLAARQLVLQLKATQQAPSDMELSRAIWQNIQQRTQPPRRIFRLSPTAWRVAASILLVISLAASAWWFQRENPKPSLSLSFETTSPTPTLEEVNRTDKILKVHLSDGSVVSLSKDSRLTYPETFDAARRVVTLSGEAFFEVQKNPDRPFLVYANETVTKVLGTSFRVAAYDDAPDVTVQVRTGRVSVFVRKDFEEASAKAQRTGVVLTPNQQAVFLKDQIQLSKTLVATPELLTPPSQKPSFNFNNTPLQKVFDTLEQAYGVEIVADADLIAHRSLTVSMEDETLYEKLDVICKTLDLTYQIVDAKVIVEENMFRVQSLNKNFDP